MPSPAAGLAAGLQGFQRGRQQRDERFAQEDALAYKRQQDQMAAERQARQDQLQSEQWAAQAEQMRATRERLAAQDGRQVELDRRNASEGGYRPVAAVQEGLDGLLGDIAPKAKETYKIGDTGYTKSLPSLAEQSAARQAAERAGEREQDYTRNLERDKMNDARDMERDRANRGSMERIAGMQISAREAAANQPPAPAKLRVVPAGTMKDFQGIQANLRELQDIENALTDPKVAGEALGLKNMLPEWAATRGMSDPALTLRGKLSNVASGIFLERSGAAVTPSEAKRLEGWTANLTDNPAKAANAIKNMRAFYEQKVADMQNTYGEETGYRPLAPRQPAPDVRNDRAPRTMVGPPTPNRRPPLEDIWR